MLYVFVMKSSKAGVIKLRSVAPHAAREGILWGPQGSHTHIDSTYID